MPAEIRNRIYGYVLGDVDIECVTYKETCHRAGHEFFISRRPRKMVVFTKGNGGAGVKASDHLAVLSVCRQFYHEARLLVFSVNDFLLHNPQDLQIWQERLNPTQLNAIYCIRVGVGFKCGDGESPQLVLTQFQGLRTVHVTVTVNIVTHLMLFLDGYKADQVREFLKKVEVDTQAVVERLRAVVPVECNIILTYDEKWHDLVRNLNSSGEEAPWKR